MAGGDPFKAFGKELLKGSGTLPSTISYVDVVAARIQRKAKEFVPVRTGALKRSIRIDGTGSTTTKMVRRVGAGGAGSGVMYAAAVEFGRYSRAPMNPQPYLRKAMDTVIRTVDKDMKKMLEAELDKFKKTFGGTI